MSSPAWSIPLHGVQHLDGLRKGFQITVEAYASFALTLVFLPGHGFDARRTMHADASAARIYGETQANELEAWL